MSFTNAELKLIRDQFSRTFPKKQPAQTLGYDEAPAAIMRVDQCIETFDLEERTSDRATLIKALDLYNRKTILFDVAAMHEYVLNKFDQLIDGA